MERNGHNAQNLPTTTAEGASKQGQDNVPSNLEATGQEVELNGSRRQASLYGIPDHLCYDRHGGGYGPVEDLSRWFRFRLPVFGDVRFNPVVMATSVVLIWSFVIWCTVDPQSVPFQTWRSWIVDNFTWLFVGSVNCWLIFLLILYFSEFSSVKLGKPEDEPDFSDVTWFVMLFACGIGVGLFFYAVAEPVYHYIGPNRYSADPTIPDNTMAQIAMNLTLYHWGLHYWASYCMVGLMLGLISHREGLPMTMKSCLYPLIGDLIFGWIGNTIDVLSIVTTLFGVCTTLGLGTRQLNAGLAFISASIPPNDLYVQIVIIWAITAIATASALTGVQAGVRRLSELCFALGMFLMAVAFFMVDTTYVMNLFVQSLGYYFQNLFQLGFHTDTFEKISPSSGGVETRNRFVPPGFQLPDGPKSWMNSWTILYSTWCISWCPFVGMFIAKISKGRTIKQFINGTMTLPVLYSFMWLVLFGGIGIKHERTAGQLGLCCKDESGWFLNSSNLADIARNRGLLKEPVIAASSYWTCNDPGCGKCAISTLRNIEKTNRTYAQFIEEYEDLGTDFGSRTRDWKVLKLSCQQTENMWFHVMFSFGDIGTFLAGFSLASIVLYFVTSADSGSLVMDSLSSNGDPDPPHLQRAFWSVTEGATATALMVAGGKESLLGLQTGGLVCGLPYVVIVSLMCISGWRCVNIAMGYHNPKQRAFAISLFDPLCAQPRERRSKGRWSVGYMLGLTLLNLVATPYTLGKVGLAFLPSTATLKEKRMAFVGHASFSGLFLLLFGIFHLAQLKVDGTWAIAWFFYCCFALHIAVVRASLRWRFNISGNVFEDVCSSLLLYPLAVVQMELTLRGPG